MKFLIAGLGSIGRRHLRNLVALGERDILLYRTYQSTLPDDELEDFPVETSLDAALAHRPDAVIVSNPTALHLDVAIPAAEAGYHILLEKPVSHNMTGIDRLVAAARTGGSRVLVGFQFRFHPGLRKAVEWIAAGEIGKPLSARAHWGEFLPRWHPWENYREGYSARSDLGGGVILTLSHPLDYLRWLLGEVNRLWAFTSQGSALQIDVEDTAEIGMQFHSGALASVHLDCNQRPSAHRLEVIGTGGTLFWDNGSGTVSIKEGDQPDGSNIVIPRKQESVPENFTRNDLFLAEMQHFLAVARGEAEPVCSLMDGVRALELAVAALQSAREGRLVRPHSASWNALH